MNIKIPCVVYDEASHKYKTAMIDIDAEPRLLVFPGWLKGVEIFVHRSVNDKTTWTVTDATNLRQVSTPVCKTRKSAIDSAIENLAKYGEYFYRNTAADDAEISDNQLTAFDAMNILKERAKWCRENGESDMRNILNTIQLLEELILKGKTRTEIIEYYLEAND